MRVIWALFDDANGSLNHLEYDRNEFTIISIGINNNDWDNYHKIDLSITNSNLIKQLKKLPKPDIIIASPPCKSWSNALPQHRFLKSFELNEKYLLMNCLVKSSCKINYYNNAANFLIGINTTSATALIIETFKPKIWIIENPQSSLIFRYLKDALLVNGFNNIAYYYNWNSNFSMKPTNFLSNIDLHIPRERIIKNNPPRDNKKWFVNVRFGDMSDKVNYNTRSSIPSELLHHILNEIKNHKPQI